MRARIFIKCWWTHHRWELIASCNANFLNVTIGSSRFLDDLIYLLLLVSVLLYHILQFFLLILFWYNYHLIGVSIDNLPTILGWSYPLRLVLFLQHTKLTNSHILYIWTIGFLLRMLNIVYSWIKLTGSRCPIMALIVIHYGLYNYFLLI